MKDDEVEDLDCFKVAGFAYAMADAMLKARTTT